MKKIYEFLLWNNCGNNCTFCHQRNHERRINDKILTPQEQIESLQLCGDFLKTRFEKGNHILLCGGEIFGLKTEEVNAELSKLLDQILDHMQKDEIELLYLNTNLLYENTTVLFDFLSKVQEKELFGRLKFTTSYDIVGRFNDTTEKLFYKNLKKITDTFKDIRIVVNTVLTKGACDVIVSDVFGANYLVQYCKDQNKKEFNIKNWMDYFRVDINAIPYIILNYENAPEAPTREEVFQTLLHIDKIIPGYLQRYSENIALKQEKLLYEYNKATKDFDFCSSKMSECGHSVNFKQSFKNCNKCFPCEIQKLLKYTM